MIDDIFRRVYEDEFLATRANKRLRSRVWNAIRPRRAWQPFAFAAAGLAVAVLMVATQPDNTVTTPATNKTDDWAFDGGSASSSFSSSAALGSSSGGMLSTLSDTFGRSPAAMTTESVADSARLGYSVGGAKDANAFRDDIENGYVPLPTDLTYEGLFYEYFFDTGESQPCADLFCPSYATASAPDPISGETDYYVTVGLNSGMTEADFARPPLDLVVVLDISGSMSSPFDRYYYDSGSWDEEDAAQSKMDVAKDAVVALMGHLNPDDRLGIVLFDGEAELAKPLRLVSETDMGSIERHLRDVEPRGNTDMSAGMDLATSLFADAEDGGNERRVILLTDAQPNAGDLSESGLAGRIADNAEDGIYATMIGIGVDFQTELVEAMTKTRGANYYAVHSPSEFRERMDEGFDFMVTPLVFDLSLEVDADGFDVEQVYGSPEAEESTGELMSVNTLFPSRTDGGETKGGVVLLKLRRTGTDATLALRASYEDRDGNRYENEATVTFDGGAGYDNAGIRKAVWLARYADLLKDWMTDARAEERWWRFGEPEPLVNEDDGIAVPPDPSASMLSRWEQTSVPLTVDDAYREAFATFREAFAEEIEAIGDTTMERETDVLNLLIR